MEDQMACTILRSLMIAVVSSGAVLIIAGSAEAQPAKGRMMLNNDKVVSDCIRQVQESVPGDQSYIGVRHNRAALFRACMSNGGKIPGSH
jgi:hypothetical protein